VGIPQGILSKRALGSLVSPGGSPTHGTWVLWCVKHSLPFPPKKKKKVRTTLHDSCLPKSLWAEVGPPMTAQCTILHMCWIFRSGPCILGMCAPIKLESRTRSYPRDPKTEQNGQSVNRVRLTDKLECNL
jgi:hypothetical protein